MAGILREGGDNEEEPEKVWENTTLDTCGDCCCPGDRFCIACDDLWATRKCDFPIRVHGPSLRWTEVPWCDDDNHTVVLLPGLPTADLGHCSEPWLKIKKRYLHSVDRNPQYTA
jgi:hypothetical protein